MIRKIQNIRSSILSASVRDDELPGRQKINFHIPDTGHLNQLKTSRRTYVLSPDIYVYEYFSSVLGQ